MIHYSQAGLPPSPTMKKDNPRVTTNSDSLSLIAGLQSGTCLIFKDRVFFEARWRAFPITSRLSFQAVSSSCFSYLSWRSYFLFLSKATFDIFDFLGEAGEAAAFLFIAHGRCCGSFVPHLFYVQRSYIIFGLSSLNFVVRIRHDELQRTGGLVLATWHAHEYRKFQKYYHGGCFVFEKLQKGEFFYRFFSFYSPAENNDFLTTSHVH